MIPCSFSSRPTDLLEIGLDNSNVFSDKRKLVSGMVKTYSDAARGMRGNQRSTRNNLFMTLLYKKTLSAGRQGQQVTEELLFFS
jgi:hypothetical protein